jgi:hypothetical protein
VLPDEIANAIHNNDLALLLWQGHMANLLYWLLIVIGFNSGFRGYPIWTILALGVVAAFTYLIDRPSAFEIGMKEWGVAYPLIIVVASLPPAGILFEFGWLAGRALSRILE